MPTYFIAHSLGDSIKERPRRWYIISQEWGIARKNFAEYTNCLVRCHSRASGNPQTIRTIMDPRFVCV